MEMTRAHKHNHCRYQMHTDLQSHPHNVVSMIWMMEVQNCCRVPHNWKLFDATTNIWQVQVLDSHTNNRKAWTQNHWQVHPRDVPVSRAQKHVHTTRTWYMSHEAKLAHLALLALMSNDRCAQLLPSASSYKCLMTTEAYVRSMYTQHAHDTSVVKQISQKLHIMH